MVDYTGKRKRTWLNYGTAGNAAADINKLLTTRQLVKLFAVPMGMHPVVVGCKGIEVGQDAVSSLYLFYDVLSNADQLMQEFTEYNIDNSITGSLVSHKSHFLRADASAGGAYVPVDVGEYELFDTLLLVKQATHVWNVAIDYYLLPGAMMWLDEWAELLRDKRNVPLSRTAGRPYNQVGDYRQAGRDF